MRKETVPPRPDRAVLYVGTESVEALACPSPGAELHAVRTLSGASAPGDLARQAAEVLEETGARGRPCQLLLTQGIVTHRVVTIPLLAPAELRRVLQRKAANLIERPEAETQFAGFPLSNGLDGAPATERGWLLAAIHRPSLVALQEELHRRGVRVRETSWERLASLGAIGPVSDAEPKATLLVGVEPESIGFTLLYGSGLVHLTTLKGSLRVNAGMASAVIQEARSLEAHWRKTSRGKDLEEVVLVGVGAETRFLLEPALHAALRGVSVRAAEHVGGEAHAGVLAAARAPSRYRFDLSVPLPRKKSVLLVSMLLAAALGTFLGVGQYKRLSARAESWAKQTATLVAAPETQEEISAQYERIVTSLVAFEKERDRVLAVASQGIPLQEVLVQALEAFRGHGSLLSLSCDAVERGQGVVINGSTTAEPSSSLAALQGLVQRLETAEAFSEVVLNPPTSVVEPPLESGVEASLDFAIQAKWRGDA